MMKNIVLSIIALMAASNLDAVFAMNPHQEDAQEARLKAIAQKTVDDAIQLGTIIAAQVEQASRYDQQTPGHNNVPVVMRTGIGDSIEAVNPRAKVYLTARFMEAALDLATENLSRSLSTADKARADAFLQSHSENPSSKNDVKEHTDDIN